MMLKRLAPDLIRVGTGFPKRSAPSKIWSAMTIQLEAIAL
jgi:hypothetical protein